MGWLNKFLGIDDRPISGAKAVRFDIDNMHEYIDVYPDQIKALQEGLYVVVMADLDNFSGADTYGVYFMGRQIGNITPAVQNDICFARMNKKLMFTVIEKIREVPNAAPAVTVCAYITDYEKGRDPLPPFVNSRIKWTNIGHAPFNGEADDNYQMIEDIYQLVDRHLELYGVKDLKPTGDNAYALALIEEDDYYFKYFIHWLSVKYITSPSDLSSFYKEIREDKKFGELKELKKRIKYYLDENAIYL